MVQKAPIVVLTGAGVSQESGISTFRDAGGVWQKYSIEDVATPEAFARQPDTVHAFYNDRRRKLQDTGAIRPNAAHEALARLEHEWPGEVTVITQNIDNLHERAGSQNLIHMHGELLKVRCNTCGAVQPWHEDVTRRTACPACANPDTLRPHVVWFGEMPFHLDTIMAKLDDCGWFLSVGTSGNVYPAAGFVDRVRAVGQARTVELNYEASGGAFDDARHGPATEVVPAFVEDLLKA